MAEFGEQLRKAREGKGMTQQSLAEKVYVTRQTVSRWEGGERYPDLVTLKKLSVVLGVGIDELLDNKEVVQVVEKNPIIEKPIINNMMVVLYALVVFTYMILGINQFPAYPNLYQDFKNDGGYLYVQLFVEAAEIILFAYGAFMTIRGKMNAKRAGNVTIGFYLLEAVQVAGFFMYGKFFVPVLIMIPYILGAAASFFFYRKQENKAIFKGMIAAASVFGAFRVIYLEYSMLMQADHLYSALNSVGTLLTVLIYVLFIYQMMVLSVRRKRAEGAAEEE